MITPFRCVIHTHTHTHTDTQTHTDTHALAHTHFVVTCGHAFIWGQGYMNLRLTAFIWVKQTYSIHALRSYEEEDIYVYVCVCISARLLVACANSCDSVQMLYTNWPSTGNSFEGAFGGYDDASLYGNIFFLLLIFSFFFITDILVDE